MDTAKTTIEITRMKNAESLSTKKPNSRIGEPERFDVKVLPKITENEKIIPNRDAMAALMKEVYVQMRSVLFNITADAAPIK